MDQQTLLILCAFGAVALLGYFLSAAWFEDDSGKLRSRLRNDSGAFSATAAATAAPKPKAVPLLQRVGQAAAQPFMPSTREAQSGLRQSLSRAGIYSPSAVRTLIGAKVILLVVGVVGGYVVGSLAHMLLMGFSVGGLLGYVAPTLWLKGRIKNNQRALEYGLADALDLMVVCVEAGLTVDSAMQRVGEELAVVHPSLSRELSIAHMETRVGLSRAESLKNLGVRTGCAALQSMSAMLVQADRFGTSIASALRIHSDSLRQARQHRAEEIAAKSAVKMSFPLVLFIFPATFIVLAGPTVIQLMNSPLMK